MFVFNSSTRVISSVSLGSSQLSRNSLKLYRSSRVFLKVSSFSCCPENATTSSSPITKNIAVAIIPNKEKTRFILQSLKRRESLDRHSGYIQKVRHSVPGCSYRIDSTSAFVSGKTLLSIKRYDGDDTEQRCKNSPFGFE